MHTVVFTWRTRNSDLVCGACLGYRRALNPQVWLADVYDCPNLGLVWAVHNFDHALCSDTLPFAVWCWNAFAIIHRALNIYLLHCPQVCLISCTSSSLNSASLSVMNPTCSRTTLILEETAAHSSN